MRILLFISFLIAGTYSSSQEVTLTPLSFSKSFELKKAPTSNVLQDYTEFSASPFKTIPKGFTLSDASVFYKFDTLNCSLFIKKREDMDGLVYYRDCEDGRWCLRQSGSHYNEDTREFDKEYSNFPNIRTRYENWFKFIGSCCDLESDCDTSQLLYKNEFVDFPDFLALDKNIPVSIISDNYITNKEYHEFLNYVVDSMMRTRLADRISTDYYLNYDEKSGYENVLDYSKSYSRRDVDLIPVLSDFYFPDHEKYYWKKQLDNRKILYSFYEIPRAINISKSILHKYREAIFQNDFGQEAKDCSLDNMNYSFSRLMDLQFIKHKEIENLKEKRDKEMAYWLKSHDCNPHVNCYPDTLSWIFSNPENNISNYRIWATSNYFTKREFDNFPVQGVNYWQAKSFLAWKTKFHNRELKRQNLPYRVFYTFPLPEECSKTYNKKISLPIIEMDKYVITNKEYEDFVVAISDSVIVRMMSNFEPETYLLLDYFDYGDERPYTDWAIDKKWLKKYYLKSVSKLKKLREFKHFETLMIKIDSADIHYEGLDNRTFYYSFMWQNFDKENLFQGRVLNLCYTGTKLYSHIYGHEDRARYIVLDKIQIFPGYDNIGYSSYESSNTWNRLQNHWKKCDSLGIERTNPDSLDPSQKLFWEKNPRYFMKEDYSMPFKTYDFKSNPDAPITAITYEQAKAYYHWKNEVPYIPTREEWDQIKQSINPYTETELEIPGPFFRYVIRVYPVRE